MDGIHDMGGMHGFGAVDVDAVESSPENWKNRLQAVAILSRGIRRSEIEAIPPADYLASSYHERWLIGAENLLVRVGRVSIGELQRWRSVFDDDPSELPPRAEAPERVPRLIERLMTTSPMHEVDGALPFDVGDRVRVKRMAPEAHHRCPRYVRGAVGVVDRVPGAELSPEAPLDSNPEPVFTVRFDSIDLWGERTPEGEPGYDLYIDLFQSYLEAP
jgi:nitrile hydratase beta subunit